MRILGMGTTEIIFILFILLLLFGANKLPELAKSLGKSLKEFKKSIKEIEGDIKEDTEKEKTD